MRYHLEYKYGSAKDYQLNFYYNDEGYLVHIQFSMLASRYQPRQMWQMSFHRLTPAVVVYDWTKTIIEHLQNSRLKGGSKKSANLRRILDDIYNKFGDPAPRFHYNLGDIIKINGEEVTDENIPG